MSVSGRPFTYYYDVKDMGFTTPCWMWNKCLNASGYGLITRNRKLHIAHRYFYTSYGNIIPEGKEIDHLCRNRACVNPDHLEPVTNTENIRRGDRTKLSVSEAQEIRKAYLESHATQAEIAKLYNVTQSLVSLIVNRHNWKEI